jgi:CubicO group peptidase (beta-lactamase class C family)
MRGRVKGSRYANTAYTLLRPVVAGVTGKDFVSYARENLFLPMGMKHSSFHFTRHTIEQRGPAKQYQGVEEIPEIYFLNVQGRAQPIPRPPIWSGASRRFSMAAGRRQEKRS